MSVIMHNSLSPSICLVSCQSFSFLSQVTSSDEFTINEAGNQKLIQDLVWVEEPQRRLPKAQSQKIFFLQNLLQDYAHPAAKLSYIALGP